MKATPSRTNEVDVRALDEQPGDHDLSGLFDQYAAAMDQGDLELAESILDTFPEMTDDFQTQLRGLYLLGKTSWEQQELATSASDIEPRRLGDFDLEYELGRGGMGIVYAARQRSLQRRVALKILPFTAVLDPRQVARFRNEAQAAASLHHANIVPVYAVGCERGVHYYSMQLIEGQSLEQFLNDLRSQTSELSTNAPSQDSTQAGISTLHSIRSTNYIHKIVEIGACAAAAIHYAHQNGIVHRDVKPSNLMLDQTGQVFVTDFGLARCQSNPGLTSQGERLGTMRYMSPEQATGRTHEVDFRTDIYSLGVTLYELLTLRAPFPDEHRGDLVNAIEQGNAVAPRKQNPSIPVDLETVVTKAMATVPEDRYSSAQALADDLFRCLSGKQVLARRPSRLERVSKWLARHQRVVLASSLAMLTMTIAAMAIATIFNGLWQRERQASSNARFFLTQANKTVERFGRLSREPLESIPGTDQIRTKLVAEAIGYYQDFLRFAEQQPGLDWDRARATGELARLFTSAGEDAESIEHFRLAIERLDALDIDPSQQQQVTTERAICLNQQGLAWQRVGQQGPAESSLREAIRTFSTLQESVFDDPEILAAFAQTQSNLGSWLQNHADPAEAEQCFASALSSIENAGESYLIDITLRSAYFKIQGNYISLLATANPGRAELELPEMIRQLQLTNELLTGESVSGMSSRTNSVERELLRENAQHIADLQNNFAVVLCRQKRWDDALVEAEAGYAYWNERHDQTPLDSIATEHLGTVTNTLGEIAWHQNSLQAAENWFLTAEQLLKVLVEQQPVRAELLSRLAMVYHNRGLLAAKNQDRSAALELIRSAMQFQDRARTAAPTNRNYVRLWELHRQVEIQLTELEPVSRFLPPLDQAQIATNETQTNRPSDHRMEFSR